MSLNPNGHEKVTICLGIYYLDDCFILSSTNDRGLGNVAIGEGITTDDLSLVNWATGPYFID